MLCFGLLLMWHLLLRQRQLLLLALSHKRCPLAEERDKHLLPKVHFQVNGRLLVSQILHVEYPKQQHSLESTGKVKAFPAKT